MPKSRLFYALSDILEAFKRELTREFNAQGHKLTGAFERSLTTDIAQDGQTYTGTITGNTYGLIVNKGVPANRIPFSPGSGAKSSKYIAALIRYFQLRKLSPDDAKRAAFATAYVHKREGMPTKASVRFSTTGKRRGFAEDTFNRQLLSIEQTLANEGAKVIEAELAGAIVTGQFTIIGQP